GGSRYSPAIPVPTRGDPREATSPHFDGASAEVAELESARVLVGVQRTWSGRRLADLDQIAIGVADVASQLGRMDFGLGDELGTARGPEVVVAADVGHPGVEKAAEDIQISRWRSLDLWLVIGRTATAVDDEPDVAKTEHRRRALAEHRRSEDVAIKGRRSPDVLDDDCMCHDELELTGLLGLSHGGLLFGGARRPGVRLPPISRRRLPRAGRAVRGRTSQKIPAPTGEPRNRFAVVAVH